MSMSLMLFFKAYCFGDSVGKIREIKGFEMKKIEEGNLCNPPSIRVFQIKLNQHSIGKKKKKST